MKTNFRNADLSGSHVHGISAWAVTLEGAIQQDLTITPAGENVITADSLGSLYRQTLERAGV